MNKRSNTWLYLVWWLYLVFTALLYCTMIQNIECEMSPRLTTPFPVNCEHFLVMMDVFIVRQMTLTTDGDYTSTLFLCSPLAGQHSRAINRNTEWALERYSHVKYKTGIKDFRRLNRTWIHLFNHDNYTTKDCPCYTEWIKRLCVCSSRLKKWQIHADCN